MFQNYHKSTKISFIFGEINRELTPLCPLEFPSKLGKNKKYIYIFPGVANNAVVTVVQFYDPIRVKGQLKGPEGQLEGSEGQQEGSESQLEGPEATWRALRDSWRALRAI